MEVKELKVLLKLVGKQGFYGKIGELKPNSKTKLTEIESICRNLRDRDWVDYQEEVIKIKLTPAGKALLKLASNQLPINPDELQILTACTQGSITPREIKITPVDYRQKLINSLIKRDFLTVAATKIKQVWLTETGKKYLLKEYNPQGYTAVLSLNFLNNYLVFLRNFLGSSSTNCNHNIQIKPKNTQDTITDRAILNTIIDLDRELGTDNYLPIFYLREKLQPPLTRSELDAALYRLQKQERLELSSLVVAENYSHEQINAGIPQTIGGRLFFLIVNR
jgi:hypothetical protein